MTIDEIINYANEKGISPKKIDQLVEELHPNENGELSIEESAQAIFAINYHIETKEYIREVLETTKAIRRKRDKTEAK